MPHTIADPSTTEARRAGPKDSALVSQLLAAHGIDVRQESLRERLESESSGVVIAGDACASWTVDAGVLHIYDIAGSASDFSNVVRELDKIANEMFTAVLVATVYSEHPLLEQLLALDFTVDWEEADVRSGIPVRLMSLVRYPALLAGE